MQKISRLFSVFFVELSLTERRILWQIEPKQFKGPNPGTGNIKPSTTKILFLNPLFKKSVFQYSDIRKFY